MNHGWWSHLRRMLVIWRILAFYRIDALLPMELPWPVRLLKLCFRMHPAWWIPNQARGHADQRLRLACEALGPVFIKLGQLIATRRDLLPPRILDELSQLQDNVRPFSPSIAVAIIELELGRPINELFMRFDMEPLAAASIAQVHTAQLFDEREVVVKILRPQIAAAIRTDMALLLALAEKMEQRWPEAGRLNLKRVILDYEKTLLNECDLKREADNTQRLRLNFLNSPLLYVPWVEPSLSTSSVMVSERIYGVPINRDDELARAGINRKVLAETGLTVFFTQLFRDNFFHADMHPGNVFVELNNPEQPRYIALDCAIIGSLRQKDQLAVARLGLALTQRDFAELIRVAWGSGWIPPGTDLESLEEAVRELVTPVLDQTIATLNFAPTLLGLLDLARLYRLTIPTQFVILLKTLVHVEGLGRGLYPDLDIWTLSRPLLTQWLADQIGPQALWRSASAALPQWLTMLPELPYLVHDALLGRQGQLSLQQAQQQQVQVLAETLPAQLRRQRQIMLAAGIWLAAGMAMHLSTAHLAWPLAAGLVVGWLLA